MGTQSPNIDTEISRRTLLRRSAGLAVAVGLIPGAGLLAGCGQGEESSDMGDAAALAKPGTDIPSKSIDFSMSPFADDTLAVIAMKLGYFDDVGIKIGPTSTGAKLNLTESIAPLVSDQVQAGSAVFQVLLSKLDSVRNVKAFVVHSTFAGFAFFAAKSGAPTVEALVKSGVPFPEAIKQAIAPYKGKSVTLSDDPSAQLFYDLVFDLAGLSEDDFDVRRVSNANMVNLALAGKTDLAAPSGGPQVVRLAGEDLPLVVSQQQVLEVSKDPRRLGLVNHSAYVTRADLFHDDYESVLRMASAIFRASDLVRKDPDAASAEQLPFLNSYAGSDLTKEDLAFLQGPISRERTFDEMDTYYARPGSFNLTTAGDAQIKSFREKKVLKRAHTVAEIDGASKVWRDLVDYRRRADELFDKVGDDPMVAKARAQYDARNYLDAYRFLASLDA